MGVSGPLRRYILSPFQADPLLSFCADAVPLAMSSRLVPGAGSSVGVASTACTGRPFTRPVAASAFWANGSSGGAGSARVPPAMSRMLGLPGGACAASPWRVSSVNWRQLAPSGQSSCRGVVAGSILRRTGQSPGQATPGMRCFASSAVSAGGHIQSLAGQAACSGPHGPAARQS